LWQSAPVQSDANSAAGGLALKFSPREVPCGGGASPCARAGDSAQKHIMLTITATLRKNGVRTARFIADKCDSMPLQLTLVKANPVFSL